MDSDLGKNVPSRPYEGNPSQIHTQAYLQAVNQGNQQATPYGASPVQIHTQAYPQDATQSNQLPMILVPQQGHAQIPSNVSAGQLPTVQAVNQGNQQATPYGACPYQIQTQAYPQDVILVPQQGHAQIPSNVSAGQLPTVMMAYTPQARPNIVYAEFKGKRSVVLGALQLAIGCLAIMMEPVGFEMQRRLDNMYSTDYYFGTVAFNIFTTVWCGVIFFIAGGFAIGSGKKKTRWLLVATAVMEAFSLLFALTLLGISSWAVADSSESCDSVLFWERGSCRKYVKVSQAMAAIMLICSVAQIIFSIWQLVLCGKVLCSSDGTTPCCTDCCDCCSPSTHPTHDQTFMFVNTVSPQSGQLVQLQVANPGGQPMNSTPAYQHDQMVTPASQVPMGQNQTEHRNITPPPAYDAIP